MSQSTIGTLLKFFEALSKPTPREVAKAKKKRRYHARRKGHLNSRLYSCVSCGAQARPRVIDSCDLDKYWEGWHTLNLQAQPRQLGDVNSSVNRWILCDDCYECMPFKEGCRP